MRDGSILSLFVYVYGLCVAPLHSGRPQKLGTFPLSYLSVLSKPSLFQFCIVIYRYYLHSWFSRLFWCLRVATISCRVFYTVSSSSAILCSLICAACSSSGRSTTSTRTRTAAPSRRAPSSPSPSGRVRCPSWCLMTRIVLLPYYFTSRLVYIWGFLVWNTR